MMLKLPKGLKKKKKGKKSKRKDEELFTSEELERYRREHQAAATERQEVAATGQGQADNEEWSKFKDLTTGVDCVLRRTQGDLDRIKSTSFFQRVAPASDRPPSPERTPAQTARPVVHLTAADFPLLCRPEDGEPSSCGEDDEDEDDQDDIFDTSYVDAAARGEVRLACVPDSPDAVDDDLFDTSHVDALICGQRSAGGPHSVDIGLAVGVLTGRIDHVAVGVPRRPKRCPARDLLLSEAAGDAPRYPPDSREPVVQSILDTDADLPIDAPIDLGASPFTSLLQRREEEERPARPEEELDEFALLAAESLEGGTAVVRLDDRDVRPVLREAWSAFEADKNESVFAECIVEDQIDVDPYADRDDPFDTRFAEAIVPVVESDEDDFDPRAGEAAARFNNRRRSSVRILLTDPEGARESITSDDAPVPDLLAGSAADLGRLENASLDPAPDSVQEIDPFDTSIVDRIVASGRVESKPIEQEPEGARQSVVPHVDSWPEFDPRASEAPSGASRRASRPENLGLAKSVAFAAASPPPRPRPPKPVTPYYSRERSVERPDSGLPSALTPAAPRPPPPAPLEDPFDTSFAADVAPGRAELRLIAREFSCEDGESGPSDLLDPSDDLFQVKALTPEPSAAPADRDPFDTSFAGDLHPGRGELRLLESEFLQ